MARIAVAFVDENSLELLGVANMVCPPRRGEDVRLMTSIGSEIAGTVSFVQWTIHYDQFSNPASQDAEVHLSVHKEIKGEES